MMMEHLEKLSKSQLGQDLWVARKLGFKKQGFFVEAGAFDGVYLSNTWLLENELKWSGICCEPNPDFLKKLHINRQCYRDGRIVYDTTGESVDLYACGELGGTAADFQEEECRLEQRLSAPRVTVETVRLLDLLKYYAAPKLIDYISLDTEGSELRILRAFDFSAYQVAIWSVEHNSSNRSDEGGYRDNIISLMRQKGYQVELNHWDMYFWREDLLPAN